MVLNQVTAVSAPRQAWRRAIIVLLRREPAENTTPPIGAHEMRSSPCLGAEVAKYQMTLENIFFFGTSGLLV